MGFVITLAMLTHQVPKSNAKISRRPPAPLAVVMIPHAIYYAHNPLLFDYVITNRTRAPISLLLQDTGIDHAAAAPGSSVRRQSCLEIPGDNVQPFQLPAHRRLSRPGSPGYSRGSTNPNFDTYGEADVGLLDITIPGRGSVIVPNAVDATCNYRFFGPGPFTISAEISFNTEISGDATIYSNSVTFRIHR